MFRRKSANNSQTLLSPFQQSHDVDSAVINLEVYPRISIDITTYLSSSYYAWAKNRRAIHP